jgi:hypothetical protein
VPRGQRPQVAASGRKAMLLPLHKAIKKAVDIDDFWKNRKTEPRRIASWKHTKFTVVVSSITFNWLSRIWQFHVPFTQPSSTS